MVDRNLIREFNVNEADLENALGESLDDWHQDEAQMDVLYDERARSFDVNKTVSGTIIRIDGEDVLVDIGYKSEGIVPLEEWSDAATSCRSPARKSTCCWKRSRTTSA